MKKRLLYISNIAGKRMNGSFNGTAICAAHELGFEFWSVANRSKATVNDIKADEERFGIRLLHIDLARSPFSFRKNYKAYKQLVQLIQSNQIDAIHCNTPIGGILGRLAGKKCKVKKVIYQAHGFHFYKGAPKKNWLIYYPVEKWLAHYTDALITINREDYQLAQKKMKLRSGGKVYYVPGVGIDTSLYDCVDSERLEKRRSLGLHEGDIAIISTGDLIKRKNFEASIHAFAKMKVASAQYYICGEGPEKENLKKLAVELNVSDRVHFLGFRSDIKQLLAACDIFLFTSRQEGLSRSLMEAMASGLPCVASRIRGNTDLFEGIEDGSLFEPDDIDSFSERLNSLAADPVLRNKAGKANLIAIQKFSTETVKNKLIDIYNSEMGVGV